MPCFCPTPTRPARSRFSRRAPPDRSSKLACVICAKETSRLVRFSPRMARIQLLLPSCLLVILLVTRSSAFVLMACWCAPISSIHRRMPWCCRRPGRSSYPGMSLGWWHRAPAGCIRAGGRSRAICSAVRRTRKDPLILVTTHDAGHDSHRAA